MTETSAENPYAKLMADPEAAIAEYCEQEGITEEELMTNLDHPSIYRKKLQELRGQE